MPTAVQITTNQTSTTLSEPSPITMFRGVTAYLHVMSSLARWPDWDCEHTLNKLPSRWRESCAALVRYSTPDRLSYLRRLYRIKLEELEDWRENAPALQHLVVKAAHEVKKEIRDTTVVVEGEGQSGARFVVECLQFFEEGLSDIAIRALNAAYNL